MKGARTNIFRKVARPPGRVLVPGARPLVPASRLLVPATLLLVAIASCSRHTEPATPATPPAASANSPTTANSAPQADSIAPQPASSPVGDGSPQIATENSGVHIEYRVYGKGDPAIILIHGWAADANYWHAQLAPLKARYTVVTVDLAGHGASSSNRTDWSMANYGGDVATVARNIPNQQLVLVGHSMGGAVALQAAPRIGDRVIGIIAVDALKNIGLPPPSPAQIDARVAPFRADFIGSMQRYVTSELFAKGAQPVLMQKVAYDMSLEPAQIAIPSLESLLRMDFSSVLPAIHVPVMAINSSLGATDATRIRKSLPGFTADIVPRTGHFLMMEAPDTVNALLLKDIEILRRRKSS